MQSRKDSQNTLSYHRLPIRTSGGLSVVGCLLALLVLVPAAQAAGEFEPNDNRDTAFGPLEGGVDYKATKETDNDVDWYVFYVRQYSQMDFSSTGFQSECPSEWGNIWLRDKDGKPLDRFDPGGSNETNHLYLTLQPGRYYIEVDMFRDYCTGDAYRLRIDPASAMTTSVECGEAIVARDSVIPLLADADKELEANAKVLGKAKRATRHAGRKLRRAKRRNAAIWRIRQARKQFRRAKRSRNKLLRIRKTRLGRIKRQHQQTLTQLDEQIAAHC